MQSVSFTNVLLFIYAVYARFSEPLFLISRGREMETTQTIFDDISVSAIVWHRLRLWPRKQKGVASEWSLISSTVSRHHAFGRVNRACTTLTGYLQAGSVFLFATSAAILAAIPITYSKSTIFGAYSDIFVILYLERATSLCFWRRFYG